MSFGEEHPVSVMLDEGQWRGIAERYRGFHDARITRVVVALDPSEIGLQTLQVDLAFERDGHQAHACMSVGRVSSLFYGYNRDVDWPNVRDDIGMWFGPGVVAVDFTNAVDEPASIDDVKSSRFWAVGAWVSLTIEEQCL